MESGCIKIYIVFLSFYFCKGDWGCKNGNNKDTDWSITQKPPGMPDKTGFHTDSANHFDKEMEKMDNPEMEFIDDITIASTPFFYILHQAWFEENDEKTIKRVFNDQYKDEETEKDVVKGNHAHMKGMLFYNGEKGFLLSHSVPNFVKIFTGNSFIYPDSGTERSQHILCTTIGKDALPIILQHIYISQPYIFPSKHIGQTFLDSDINAKNINDNEFEKNPVTTTLDFKTPGGLEIKIFTMSTSSKDLLWYEFSKEYSTQEFDVVTEFKGPALKTKENLRNVLTTRSSDGKKWGHGKDHAKYAISNSDRIGIGDINYRKIKSLRSGGIYSFISEKYVKAHRKIFKYECSGKRCADEKRP